MCPALILGVSGGVLRVGLQGKWRGGWVGGKPKIPFINIFQDGVWNCFFAPPVAAVHIHVVLVCSDFISGGRNQEIG
jgi:hypothetical protein